MTDREKVVNGLVNIFGEAYERWVYSQFAKDKLWTLIADTMPDAITLLREQEPVVSDKVQTVNRTDYFCRNCSTKVGMLFLHENAWRFHYNFCPHCGRKVEWND